MHEEEKCAAWLSVFSIKRVFSLFICHKCIKGFHQFKSILVHKRI